jgi:hypothetical protein
VERLYGAGLARELQSHARETSIYYARCKRVAVLSQWIAGEMMETIERAATTNSYQGRITSGNIRGFADATRFHLGSAAKIATVLLLSDAPEDEAVDALLRQLETGLPFGALDLLNLPVSLVRGEYLALYRAGLDSLEKVLTASPERLTEIVGPLAAAQVLLRK